MGIRSVLPRAALALTCAAMLLWLGARNVFWSDYFDRGLARVSRAPRRRHRRPAAHDARVRGLRVADRRTDLAARRRDGHDLPPAGDPRPARARRARPLAARARARRTRCWRSCWSPARPSPTSRSMRATSRMSSRQRRGTAGVLAAVRGRATASAVLLTVAVIAKQTAVLALLPAALALPRPKLRVLAVPVIGARDRLRRHAFPAACRRHTHGLSAGSFFHPWQVWWLVRRPGRSRLGGRRPRCDSPRPRGWPRSRTR